MLEAAAESIIDAAMYEKPLAEVVLQIGSRLQILIAPTNRWWLKKGREDRRKKRKTYFPPWTDEFRAAVGHHFVEWARRARMITYDRVPTVSGHRFRKVVLTESTLMELRSRGELYTRSFSNVEKPDEWSDRSPRSMIMKSGESQFSQRSYDAANRLQSTQWIRNERLYRTYYEAYASGIAIGKLPHGQPPPWEKRNDDQMRSRMLRRRKSWRSERRTASVVAYAASVLPKDPFYFQWKADFRGRVYPSALLVHPQGPDPGRAMLQFAHGLRIGESSRYLAHHGAVCWGIRDTYETREAWVEANTEHILASAAEPLDYRWWCKASDPWKFLAFCFEWQGFKRDGEDFVTHLPCQIDGSCNGFQIASLLLRDRPMAEAVNVVATDQPADIYTKVADGLVPHAAENFEWGDQWLELVGGKFPRDLVKQPCLAAAFGGTTRVSRESIKGWVFGQSNAFPFDGVIYPPSAWLAGRIQATLLDLMPRMWTLSSWLRTVATRRGSVPEWTSPIGIKIRGDYRERVTKSWDARLYRASDLCGDLRMPGDQLDEKAAIRSFTPSFIHSIDASVMMEVVNRTDFDLSGIHDCWVAQAPNMLDLHRTVRKAYADIFAEDLLEKLARDMGVEIDLPEYGDLCPSEIRSSPYCVS